jgi:hypothetical protein
MLVSLDQHMLIVDVFDDEFVVVFAVDFEEDGFDRGVAFDEDAFRISVSR